MRLVLRLGFAEQFRHLLQLSTAVGTHSDI